MSLNLTNSYIQILADEGNASNTI